jgi:hypothetical protein
MAETDPTSGSQRSTARKALPVLACVLLLSQSAAIVWLWQQRTALLASQGQSVAPTAVPAPSPPPDRTGLSAGRLGSEIVIPPMPTLGQGLPSSAAGALPGRGPGVVPPLPVALPPGVVNMAPPTAAPLAQLQAPAPASSPGASTARLHTPAPGPQQTADAAPAADVPSSVSGDPALDELLENARQMRQLGAPEAALEALRKADLAHPDNPALKRELAFTLQKMGRGAEASAIGQSSPSPAPAPRGASGSLDFPPLGGTGSSPPSLSPPKGPIRIGTCEVKRDMTSPDGSRMNFSVPLVASSPSSVQATQMNVDVFLYEQTEEGKIELRRGEQAVFAFDEAVNFATGTEFLNVTFGAFRARSGVLRHAQFLRLCRQTLLQAATDRHPSITSNTSYQPPLTSAQGHFCKTTHSPPLPPAPHRWSSFFSTQIRTYAPDTPPC